MRTNIAVYKKKTKIPYGGDSTGTLTDQKFYKSGRSIRENRVNYEIKYPRNFIPLR